MPSSLLVTTAFLAAPWPVTLTFDLRPSAELVPLYEVVDGERPVYGDHAQDVLGLIGPIEAQDALGGVDIARDGSRLIYSFWGGGLDYHDLDLISSERPIQPHSRTWLLTEADALLEDLGLLDVEHFELVPGRTSVDTISRELPSGRLGRPQPTHQTLHYDAYVDGLPTVGPGNTTDVRFSVGGQVSEISDNQRVLSLIDDIEVDPADEALARYLDRAEHAGKWNLYLADVGSVDEVEIDAIDLALFLPDSGIRATTIEPVYVISGTVFATDTLGNPTHIDLLWWEPAIAGHTLPGFEELTSSSPSSTTSP